MFHSLEVVLYVLVFSVSESGSGAVCPSLIFYKLKPWWRTHPSCVSESGSGAIRPYLIFYKLNPWWRTHPSCVSESGSGAMRPSLIFYKLNPRLRTHTSCVSESGSGAVHSSLRRSTVRRSQSTDVTRHCSQRTVPGAVLDVYRYVCACVRASMRAK